MDILILAIINVILAIGIGVWEYFSFASKREQFYSRIQTPGDGEIPKVFFLLPPNLFKKIRQKNSGSKRSSPRSLLDEFTLTKVLMLNAGLGLISFNLSNIFNIPWYVTVCIGVILECLLYLYAKNKQQKIKDEIEKKLPEILEIMARVYRVHSDLRVALTEVAEKVHESVIKEKFSQMVRLSRFGYTVEESIEQIAKEIKSSDFDFVVTSIKLNIPVGGDISHLFEHTAKLLRQRKEAKTEIDNLMFQSKISSVISALLVPAIIFVAFSSSEKYQEVLLYNPTGRLVFFCCLFWWILGVIMIRKNSRIRI